MKRILLGLAAIVVLLLIFFGRDLLDLYRLLSYVETSTAAYEADGPWPQLTDACSGCHGDQGNSLHSGYPSLAGQPAAYLAAQLQHFASGKRSNPNMGPLAMSLSEAEIQQIAAHYAKQKPSAKPTFTVEPALVEKGRQAVASRACAACHGESLMGRDLYPRLAGQGHDYLLAQLEAFAAGTRRDPSGAMNALAATAPAEERKAMAHYLATLAPANP